MENEKQLTAMMMLRDRLLERIKSDSCSEYEENILNEITHLIDTELLATERQQLIDIALRFGNVHFEDLDKTATNYLLNTFKTQ